MARLDAGVELWVAPRKRLAPLTLAEVERMHIVAVLGMARGDRKQAADWLGITSAMLGKKIKIHGIEG